VLRLIGKWLQAGVLEDGRHHRPESGTPQGGVISPLLANVYLHEVLDLWFHREVLPRMQGRAFLVRYADDFVIAFERQNDALRVHDVLPKRFAKHGPELPRQVVGTDRPKRTFQLLHPAGAFEAWKGGKQAPVR